MLLSFIDNTSGFFALKKGYCKDLPICNLIALVWRVLAHHGWHLHLEWVQSEFNISDQVSRHNFDEMHSMGAQWLDLNTQQIFQILHQVATDADYAHGRALQDILNIDAPKLQPAHTGGWGMAPVWR